MNSFDEFLLWERTTRDTIDFKKIYVDIAGDLVAGLVLSQIIFWYLPDKNGNSKMRVKKDGYDWIAKTSAQWYDEIRITEWQAPRALNILEEKGIIEKRRYRFNGSPTIHIRLIQENFMALWEEQVHDLNGFEGKPQIQMSESLNSLTETTTEITYKDIDDVVNDAEQKNSDTAEIFKAYESEIGMLTSFVRDDVMDAIELYPKDWIIEAIKVAAKNNARKWSYVEAVLKSWKVNGYKTDVRANKQNGKSKQPKSYLSPGLQKMLEEEKAERMRLYGGE
jgi:DnaD/phage-associated family protein